MWEDDDLVQSITACLQEGMRKIEDDDLVQSITACLCSSAKIKDFDNKSWFVNVDFIYSRASANWLYRGNTEVELN